MRYKLKKKVSLLLLVLIVLMPIGYSAESKLSIHKLPNGDFKFVTGDIPCPAPSECEIKDAYWEVIEKDDDGEATQVKIIVFGDKCKGDYEVSLWNDFGISAGDDWIPGFDDWKVENSDTIGFPNKIRFIDGKAVFEWSVATLKDEKEGLGGKLDYYFKINDFASKSHNNPAYMDDPGKGIYGILKLTNINRPAVYKPDEIDEQFENELSSADLANYYKNMMMQGIRIKDSTAALYYSRKARELMVNFVNNNPNSDKALEFTKDVLLMDTQYFLYVAAKSNDLDIQQWRARIMRGFWDSKQAIETLKQDFSTYSTLDDCIKPSVQSMTSMVSSLGLGSLKLTFDAMGIVASTANPINVIENIQYYIKRDGILAWTAGRSLERAELIEKISALVDNGMAYDISTAVNILSTGNINARQDRRVCPVEGADGYAGKLNLEFANNKKEIERILKQDHILNFALENQVEFIPQGEFEFKNGVFVYPSVVAKLQTNEERDLMLLEVAKKYDSDLNHRAASDIAMYLTNSPNKKIAKEALNLYKDIEGVGLDISSEFAYSGLALTVGDFISPAAMFAWSKLINAGASVLRYFGAGRSLIKALNQGKASLVPKNSLLGQVLIEIAFEANEEVLGAIPKIGPALEMLAMILDGGHSPRHLRNSLGNVELKNSGGFTIINEEPVEVLFAKQAWKMADNFKELPSFQKIGESGFSVELLPEKNGKTHRIIVVEDGTDLKANDYYLVEDVEKDIELLKNTDSLKLKEDITNLINGLKESELRENSFNQLVFLGELAVPELVASLENDKVAGIVENVLAKIGEPAVPYMINNLERYNPYIKNGIIEVLVKIGEPAAPYVKNAIIQHKFSFSELNEKMGSVLGRIGGESNTLFLVGLLTNNPSDHSNVMAALEGLQEIGPSAVSYLKKLFADPSLSVNQKEYIIVAFGRIRDETSIMELVMIAKSTDSKLAALSLYYLTPLYPNFILPLTAQEAIYFINGLRDIANNAALLPIKTEAVHSLAKMQFEDMDTVNVLIDIAKNSQDAGVRRETTNYIGAIGANYVKKRTEVVNGLIDLLDNSPYPEVRLSAIEGLGRINDPIVVPALIKALDDAEPDVRTSAIKALTDMGPLAVPDIVQSLNNYGFPGTSPHRNILIKMGLPAVPELVKTLRNIHHNVKLVIEDILDHMLPSLGLYIETHQFNEIQLNILSDYLKNTESINQKRIYVYTDRLWKNADDINTGRRTIEDIIKEADKGYLDFEKKAIYNKPIDDYTYYVSLLSGIKFKEDITDLATKFGVNTEGRLYEDIIRDIDSKVTTLPINEHIGKFDFSTEDVELKLPEAFEDNLKNIIKDSVELKSELTIDSIKKEIDGINEKADAFDETFLREKNVPQSLIATAKSRNDATDIKKYIYKRLEISQEKVNLILSKVFEKIDKDEGITLSKNYLEGSLTVENKNLFFTKLSEADTTLEDIMKDMGISELTDNIKSKESWKVITDIKQKITETMDREIKTSKTVEMLFQKKNILDLYQGKFAGTCFGACPYDMARDYLINGKIVDKGEWKGGLLLAVQNNKLIIIGIDPSEKLVASLSEAKKFELVDKLMSEVFTFAEKNNFELLITIEAGGLSNREGIEEYVLQKYSSGQVVPLQRMTFHPTYNYVVDSAYRAKK